MLSKMAKDMRSLKYNFLNSVSDFNMCEGKLIIKVIMFPGMKIQYYITTM